MRQKLLQCLQIKSLPSTGGSVLRTTPLLSVFFNLTLPSTGSSTLGGNKTMWGRKGMWHMKCCMPNPPHGQGLHLQQKKRTLKHKSNKSGDQSFFYVQLSCSVPAASWATQAQSLISMWSLTWTRHHAVNMKGYANTQALSLSLSHTHALIHNALVLLCLSLMSLKKGSKHKN